MVFESTTSIAVFSKQEAMYMACVMDSIAFLSLSYTPPQVDRSEYTGKRLYVQLAGKSRNGNQPKPNPPKPEKPKPPKPQPDRKGDKESGRPKEPKTRRTSSLLHFLLSLFL
jgi:hypothetical protein